MTGLMWTATALLAVGTAAPERSRSAEGDPEPIILKADRAIYRLAWAPTAGRSPSSAWVSTRTRKRPGVRSSSGTRGSGRSAGPPTWRA